MRMFALLAIVGVSQLVLSGCDDGTKADDSSADTGTSAPTTTSSTEVTTDTDTPTDTDTDTDTDTAPAGCATLCSEAASAGTAEGACASQTLQGMGYDVVGAPYECAAIAGNEVGCNACMDVLGVSGEDCLTVRDTCL